jgi:hypothetical protein
MKKSRRRAFVRIWAVSFLFAVACGGHGIENKGDTNEVTGVTSQAVTTSSLFASPSTTCVALGDTPDVSCVDTSTSGFSFVPNSSGGLFGLANSPLGKVVNAVGDVVGAVSSVISAYQTAQEFLKAVGVIAAKDPDAAIKELSAHVDAVAVPLQYNMQDIERYKRLDALIAVALDIQGRVKNQGVWPLACDTTVAPCHPGQLDQTYWDQNDAPWTAKVYDGAASPAFHRVYVDSLTDGGLVDYGNPLSLYKFGWKNVISYTKADLLPDLSGGNVYDWRVALPALLQLDALRLALFAAEDPQFQHNRSSRFAPSIQKMHDDLLNHLQILESGLRCNAIPDPASSGWRIACADIFTGLNETLVLQCGPGGLGSCANTPELRAAELKAYHDVRGMTPWFQTRAMVDTLYLLGNGLSDLTYGSQHIVPTGAPTLCLNVLGSGGTDLSNCSNPSGFDSWVYDRTQWTLASTIGSCLNGLTPDPGHSPDLTPCKTAVVLEGLDMIPTTRPIAAQMWSYDAEHQYLNNGLGNALEIPGAQFTSSGTLVGVTDGTVVTTEISADLGGPQGALGPDLQQWGASPWFPPQRWQGGNPDHIDIKLKGGALLSLLDTSKPGIPWKVVSAAPGVNGAIYGRTLESGHSQAPTAVTLAGFAPPTAAMAGGQQTANQVDAFVVANDGKVYVTSVTNGGSWQAPSPLTAAGFAPPGASLATATQGGQLGVAVVDNSGKLEIIWWNALSGWGGPVAVTGAHYAPPGAAVIVGRRASGELDALSIGTDGALKYMAYSAGLWSGPWLLTVGSFAPPGAPVATAVDVHGYLNVFTIGNDGAVYTKWDCTSLWCGPTALTATGVLPVGGNVSAINFSNGSLDAFVVDKTGTIDVLSNAGSSWKGPTALSNPNIAVPGAATGAVLEGSSQLDLFAVSSSGRFVEATDVGGTWTAPAPFE